MISIAIPRQAGRGGKRTVSVSVSAVLYAQAKELGATVLKLADEAPDKPKAMTAERIKADIRQDLAAYNTYAGKHGAPADLIRAHYADPDAV